MELDALMADKVKRCYSGFACLLCGKVSERKSNMKTHMRDVHMTPRQYKCPVCDKLYRNAGILMHIPKNHPELRGIDYESLRVNSSNEVVLPIL